MTSTSTANVADCLGATASAFCLLHCTVVSASVLALPLLVGTEGGHESRFWSGLDYIFLAISLVAVWYAGRGTRHSLHRRLLWLAWFVFAAGILAESFRFAFGHGLMYLGSVGLIVVHLLNMRHRAHGKLNYDTVN
jgi:hypothetical protein